MDCVNKKSVFIPEKEHVKYYYYNSNEEFNYDWIRESLKRKSFEQLVYNKPHTQLERVRNIIASWRKYEISVVFGNLGRQPYLLNYYLDMCFGSQEDINVICRWNLNSNYQSNDINKSCDFLFLVEPVFGFTILKPLCVKHMIVLTSHLHLHVSNPSHKYFLMHLSNSRYGTLQPDLRNSTIYKPPIYIGQYDENIIPVGPVVLDLRESKSANEAYLRLLTGKELIRRRPFKILMNERDHKYLQKLLPITKIQIKQFEVEGEWEKFYFDI